MHDMPMKITARKMVEDIRAAVRSLAIHPGYGSLTSAMREISDRSGVSVSLIHKIYDGRANNPTADTIDKLGRAIESATRKAAA
jgi:transcriptional regulator with XRE-family HTH domain